MTRIEIALILWHLNLFSVIYFYITEWNDDNDLKFMLDAGNF